MPVSSAHSIHAAWPFVAVVRVDEVRAVVVVVVVLVVVVAGVVVSGRSSVTGLFVDTCARAQAQAALCEVGQVG